MFAYQRRLWSLPPLKIFKSCLAKVLVGAWVGWGGPRVWTRCPLEAPSHLNFLWFCELADFCISCLSTKKRMCYVVPASGNQIEHNRKKQGNTSWCGWLGCEEGCLFAFSDFSLKAWPLEKDRILLSLKEPVGFMAFPGMAECILRIC